MKQRHKTYFLEWGKHLAVIVLVILTLYPFLFLLITSFKNYDQFVHKFWLPALPLHLENYFDAFDIVGKYIANSLVASSATVVTVIFLASLVGFVFARYAFPGKEILYFAIIVLLMIPGILTLIPSFIVVRDLGLLDTRWSLILPWIAGGQVFAIFVLRNFYASLPEEIFEAARIDGASSFQLYYRIAVPLSYPIIISVGILNFVGTWNDIIWPLITISSDNLRPVTVGLMGLQNMYYQDYGTLFAGYVLASVPVIIIFIFTMKYYIKGLTTGAIKL